MLSVFPDLVRRKHLRFRATKLGEGLPRLPHSLDNGLRGLSWRRTPAARRVDFDEDLRHVAFYAAEFPGLSQRLAEAPDLIDQPEFQGLGAGPHPSAGDAFEGHARLKQTAAR